MIISCCLSHLAVSFPCSSPCYIRFLICTHAKRCIHLLWSWHMVVFISLLLCSVQLLDGGLHLCDVCSLVRLSHPALSLFFIIMDAKVVRCRFLDSSNGPCGTSIEAIPSRTWFSVIGCKSFGLLDLYPKVLECTIHFAYENTGDISFQVSVCCLTAASSARFVCLIRLS